ncbi:single-stranded DNA-binding protein [Flavobacterium zepuense]|uniref:Single-stranded DNA-binding protein n=1 Tax=Flavobacterium zepuense TaxID=2593302 RepID=A0A552UUW9_9FLAO|nr:single-stranded DNA-binding protein [Flavobacterium zepuense]TRW21987.1 single-stranded DNA-binding protein [Flavobacterium zepuense]
MEIAGRITADATVKTVSGDKEVVNFSIAINDSYKPKGSSEYKDVVTYIKCAYWLSAKRAQVLKKGAVVQVIGRIGMDVYNNMDGQAVGSLTFHTNDFKVLTYAKKADGATAAPAAQDAAQEQNSAAPEDDLPF